MADDIIKLGSPLKEFLDNRGDATLISHPVLVLVKNNIDPTRSGRIKVYIDRFGAPNSNDAKYWITVRYLSPFFGNIAPGYSTTEGSNKTTEGTFVGNPQSYGFWASAPDIGSYVVCIFLKGDPEKGYYIGCVPPPGLTHMVPATAAAADSVVPNSGEASTFGGANRLPVSEVNNSNPSISNSPTIFNAPKPIHSYQAGILIRQGLIRDDIRGVISSSSQRESPSRVFGMSTPGGIIYEGGFTNGIIGSAINTSDISKLQPAGRAGGHSLVMDDGTLNGRDQLMRFRTSAGHTILMSDSGQVLTIIHSNGQSWIELGKEGTIDMYSSNSVSIRTEGDFNLNADQDINIHAKRKLNMFADNIKIESDQNITQRSGKDFIAYYQGKCTYKVDGAMSFASGGNSSFYSSAITYINGSKINLNTGASATVPTAIDPMPKVNHVDSVFSEKVGWMNPSPNPLLSITSRTPTHMPWAEANKGVDVAKSSI